MTRTPSADRPRLPDQAVGPYRSRIEHVDTDATGVVHFSRFTSLLETAGLEFLEGLGVGLTAFEEAGVRLVVTELCVSYLHSAVYRDRIVGRARVAHVGGARFRVAAELSRLERDGAPTPLVRGTLTFAAVDPVAQRAVPLPAGQRLALKGVAAHGAGHE